MEFKINSTDLLKALSHIHGIVEVRHTLPILSNIILEARDDHLILSSTNLDIYCSDKIKAEVIKSGEVSVSAVTFFEIIKRLPSGSEVSMIMEEGENEIRLTCGRSRFNLSTLKTDDFPIISDNDLSTNFVLSADELIRIIDKTKFAVSNEETRYYLNGIFLHKAERNSIQFLRAVATDGHRLAQYDIPLPQGAEDITGIIIPKKTIYELRKVLDDANGDVSVSLNENKIKFSFNDLKVVSKVIDGTFPDYTKVIPQKNDKNFKTNNSDLKNAIDRVSAVAANEESKSKAIKFCIENNSLSLSVESQSKGSANEMIDVNYSGDKVDIGFNSKYIIDLCNEVDGDEISISLSDSISPAIILDKTDENLFFVLMPMRI
jgi:DNA polymerase-3 subunit beta